MAEIFIYSFTAMLRDVTGVSLLCLCIICYKTDVPTRRQIREQEHFCRNVMVSVGVSHKGGKTNMIFVDPGAKDNSSYYCRFVLGKGLLPDIEARCRQHKCTYQQDGAPAHTAGNNTDYLKKEKIDFIEPHMWPPNSPDLNPVDYAVWGSFSKESTTDENLTQWKN